VHKALGLPVELMDERLSSWEAQETIAVLNSNPRARRQSTEAGAQRKKKTVDDVAAAIILRDYLQRARPGSRD
jgi:RNase H-fold protein (predicted Holliday junction resolvase)